MGLTQRAQHGVRRAAAEVHRRGLTEYNLMLSVMEPSLSSSCALIRERQRGNVLATARSFPPGRKKSLNSEQIAELKRRVAAGDQNLGGSVTSYQPRNLYQYLRED